MNKIFEGNITERRNAIKGLLHADINFDILKRNMWIGGKEASFYSIDGFLKGDLTERLMEYFYAVKDEEMPSDIHAFMSRCVPYADIVMIEKEDDFISFLLSGMTCLVIDGYSQIIGLDLRNYPARSVNEPDKDRVLRGSRDGFVEAIVPNVSLIRRRIKDVNLIFEVKKVGRSSKTDIVVSYMKGRVGEDVVKTVMTRIDQIDVDSLTMNQESFAEAICPKHWFNPFPKFKYTERPDTAAACLLEGSIVILIDNSPAAMVIPTSLFDIIEDANDYYFPPITGTYLRLTRMCTNLMAVFITPLYLLFLEHPDWVPNWLEFILIKDDIYVNPLLQLLILELAVDGLKLASINTPSMLTTPLSVVAAIVFGDYTVQSGWFNSQIMLYMAFVAVANYTQSNMELGYAIKFHRIILLILTEIFGLYGFIGGSLLLVITPVLNKTFVGRGYLYPLVPFDKIQLFKRFFRISLAKNEKFQNAQKK